jgi:hypothetical protein
MQNLRQRLLAMPPGHKVKRQAGAAVEILVQFAGLAVAQHISPFS